MGDPLGGEFEAATLEQSLMVIVVSIAREKLTHRPCSYIGCCPQPHTPSIYPSTISFIHTPSSIHPLFHHRSIDYLIIAKIKMFYILEHEQPGRTTFQTIVTNI